MSASVVTKPEPSSVSRSFKIRLVLAFFAIYILWGTTFLGIRVAVEELPPVFAAGARRGCLRVTSREYTFMYFL